MLGSAVALAAAADRGVLAALEAVPFHVGVDERVIFESSFEPGQPRLSAKDHQLVEAVARTGRFSMMARVDAPMRARFLEIPFKSRAGRVLHVSCWLRSDKRSAAALFVQTQKMRAAMTRRIDNVPADRWVRIEGRYEVPADCSGVVQIVAPSSHSAPVGRMWVDDVRVWETVSEVAWPGTVRDFPQLAYDGRGQLWMALLERSQGRSFVRLGRPTGHDLRDTHLLEVDGSTGIGPPALAGLPDGCIVAFAVERNDRWRIAYASIGHGSAGRIQYLDCRGSANISPTVAVVGRRACILWESNAGAARAIYACWIGHDGPGPIERISAENVNSYNPAVVALEDGSLFAAWDSLRDKSADIYGAWYRHGGWQDELRITRDPRIERHPALAVRGSEIWLAWQMQSYPGTKLNRLTEQRIAVARITGGGLEAPVGLFEQVSTARRMLLRPKIVFDGAGRLWLSARQSLGQNAGWRPVVWSYSGRKWSPAGILMDHQGRWRGASLASCGPGVSAACQYDDLSQGWDQTRGVYRDWRSGILVKTFTTQSRTRPVALETEPIRTDRTDFSLAEKMEICAAELPRQKLKFNTDELTLFWGDFHDHTDISVCDRRGNPPGHDLFANVRDIERLDFCALTDHGYNFDGPQWAFNGEQTRNNHDPGRFVTFLAEEWTSSRNPPAPGGIMNRYGHRNLVFLDPYHQKFYDSFDGDISPAELWKQLQGVEFICIPHQLADWKGRGRGNPPTDWNYVDERLQPVAEIFQGRGSYEYLGCPRQAGQGAPFEGNYLQDAWAKGIVIGVIASPDHGGGTGKVGVWARELTRQAIFDAVRKRHTFGTSGAKMGLFFSAGTVMMGDKVQRPPGPIEFRIKAVAMRAIKELVIFRNNEIVHRLQPDSRVFDVRWTDAEPPDVKLAWYYARIHAEDDELAWSSPIWFTSQG